MIVKAGTAAVKYRKLKEKSQIIKPAKAIKVSKAKGKLVYKYIKAKKGKQNFRKYFKIGTRSGKVKVRKGLKRGTCKIKTDLRFLYRIILSSCLTCLPRPGSRLSWSGNRQLLSAWDGHLP